MDLTLIPKWQRWLVVSRGVVVAARGESHEAVSLAMMSGHHTEFHVLEQCSEHKYHLGQKVMPVEGKAVPCIHMPATIRLEFRK